MIVCTHFRDNCKCSLCFSKDEYCDYLFGYVIFIPNIDFVLNILEGLMSLSIHYVSQLFLTGTLSLKSVILVLQIFTMLHFKNLKYQNEAF